MRLQNFISAFWVPLLLGAAFLVLGWALNNTTLPTWTTVGAYIVGGCLIALLSNSRRRVKNVPSRARRA